jgi:hypothetical protein
LPRGVKDVELIAPGGHLNVAVHDNAVGFGTVTAANAIRYRDAARTQRTSTSPSMTPRAS